MKFIGVKIPDDLHKALEATGRPKSEIVREALEAYLGLEREIPHQAEIIKLIDERIAGLTDVKPKLNEDKTKVKPELNEDKTKVKLELNESKTAIQRELNESKTKVKHVLQVIKSFHDQGIEPTAEEVARSVGMESRPLGRLMKEAGVQAQNVHRGGVKARRYTFDLKEKIEELLEE